MSKLALALKALKAGAKTVNWYKWLVVLVMFSGYSLWLYSTATHKAEQACLAAKVTKAEAETQATIDEVKERAPVINRSDRETAELRAELKLTRERLQDAIDAQGENPACDLSTDEYNGFRLLADKTKAK